MAERYALITGCGRGGIGEALVLEYRDKGFISIATVLPRESKDHLELDRVICLLLDVSQDESVRNLKHEVQKITRGRLHVLANNAGICYTMTAIDTEVDVVERMFQVNVFGPMRMVHEFHPLLIQVQGKIINIGSVGGLVPYIYGSSYNASKAALHHWGNTLRVEMAPLGVKVINIISGNIGTNILKSDAHRRLPEDSYYAPMSAEFQAHVQRVPDTTLRFKYAKAVVNHCVKQNPSAWFWYGKTAWIVHIADIFGPRRFWDYVLWPIFNLGKLQMHTQERQEQTSA